MASKADRFYFENFTAAADCARLAAEYLTNCLKNYRPERLSQMVSEIHRLEHDGDEKKHEMSAALAKAFVTPVDREDLALISQNIDEVTDSIEEVLQRFYMDAVAVVPPHAVEFAEKNVEMCTLMRDMMTELPGFKRPTRLHEMIVEMNRLEEECDSIYLEAMRQARLLPNADVWTVLSARKIYECLEACADACEHVGDCIETVIMKNT